MSKYFEGDKKLYEQMGDEISGTGNYSSTNIPSYLIRIEGNFDFEHLKKIHNFLFGDIYDGQEKLEQLI